ncbi:hypothetical protein PIB30_088159 [Stylosanthes scabra]|uniref:Uncharacterized protein n=1 Tax=Stylosanthes scabra TaxID=79078 RepID=A0ABU6SVC3_9FABA|nr:hypothetical protein [Stylosanthes scabra]
MEANSRRRTQSSPFAVVEVVLAGPVTPPRRLFNLNHRSLLKAQGAVLAESNADQQPLSHHSSRRHSCAVIVVTETRRVRKTKKRSEPESLHQRQGSGTQPQAREKGEHPSHASQSREPEIASSSFSPVSGPEGNSLHCLVKKCLAELLLHI